VVLAGARGYLPSLGRFLSVDPVVGGNDDPYCYPQDPINSQDVTGRYREPPTKGYDWGPWGHWGPTFKYYLHGSPSAGWVGAATQGVTDWTDLFGPDEEYRGWYHCRVRFSSDKYWLQDEIQKWVQAREYVLIGAFGIGLKVPQGPWHTILVGVPQILFIEKNFEN
jgi:hypothetical protein